VASRVKATIDDLYKIHEKAELVNGEIVIMSPTGIDPKFAGDEIFFSLRTHVKQTGAGRAVGDNAAFRVHLPNRESFSPDAAYFSQPASGMKFFEGAPDFTVEVRSEGDYGPKAERDIAAKRADYFAAGALVVWDVDLLSADVVRSYDSGNPTQAKIFRRGDIANAEPAVPGWTMNVDDLFAS
jgi:Uma2 family endonuclease